ncbi:MAG: hypothetical protein V4577_11725, partial [Bacteroidota bacterium]
AKNARSREKYAANADYFKDVQRRWRERNRDRKREISHAYMDRNRNRLNARQRAKNKTLERKAYMHVYALKHRTDHPEMYQTYSENRRSRKLGTAGSFTFTEWIEKCELFAWCCAYCGEEHPPTQLNVSLTYKGTRLSSRIRASFFGDYPFKHFNRRLKSYISYHV